MNIYRHPRNQAIIATNATHCVYIPDNQPSNIASQLTDAHQHLQDVSKRCFEFDPTLTDQMLDAPSQSCKKPTNTEPDTPLSGPDLEHGEPEPDQKPDS